MTDHVDVVGTRATNNRVKVAGATGITVKERSETISGQGVVEVKNRAATKELVALGRIEGERRSAKFTCSRNRRIRWQQAIALL